MDQFEQIQTTERALTLLNEHAPVQAASGCDMALLALQPGAGCQAGSRSSAPVGQCICSSALWHIHSSATWTYRYTRAQRTRIQSFQPDMLCTEGHT